MQHISEDALELFAMKTLPEPEARPLKHHLLECKTCKDRLQAIVEYVAAMRTAIAQDYRTGEGREPRRSVN